MKLGEVKATSIQSFLAFIIIQVWTVSMQSLVHLLFAEITEYNLEYFQKWVITSTKGTGTMQGGVVFLT